MSGDADVDSVRVLLAAAGLPAGHDEIVAIALRYRSLRASCDALHAACAEHDAATGAAT